MSIAVYLKENLKHLKIPVSLGILINKIPYSLRPGLSEIYSKRLHEIKSEATFSTSQAQNAILYKTKNIVSYAYENIDFYKEYYDLKKFKPSDLKEFRDIDKIPIVTKDILKKYDIESRSSNVNDRYVVNTGGSSGTPFNLYIQSDSMGHEWAHMHTIWNRLNYKTSDLKLTFGGRSSVKNVVDYDVVRNSVDVDIYSDFDKIEKKLIKFLKRHKIKYLHGYPSSIYEFALNCEEKSPKLKELLSKTLEGAFFGSEYPYNHYREQIEKTFGIQTISWYGHTERAVLAGENGEKFKYFPFQTYGYAEAIKDNNENHFLIGTSYYNFASPLIRYNTEDIISDVSHKDGILEHFSIKEGRSSDVIFDKNGTKINLTGLIFGRHHELFNFIDFIQVSQSKHGELKVFYVSKSLPEEKAKELFNSSNVEIDFSFQKIDKPFKTVSGKMKLLIDNI